MADALTILTAQGAAAAARPLMNLSRSPTVVNHGDHVSIELDSGLQAEIAGFIIRQIDAEPGEIRIEGLGGVFARVAARKYGTWAAGFLGGAFGLGWLTGGRRKGRKA